MKPNPKIKKAFKSGAPRKGYKWKEEDTTNKLPNPPIVPDKKKAYKPKPMRMISSGSYGSGAPRTTEKSRAKSL